MSQSAARVACRALGVTEPFLTPAKIELEQTSALTDDPTHNWLHSGLCSGDESSLIQCPGVSTDQGCGAHARISCGTNRTRRSTTLLCNTALIHCYRAAHRDLALATLLDGRFQVSPTAARGVLVYRIGSDWHPAQSYSSFGALGTAACRLLGLSGDGAVFNFGGVASESFAPVGIYVSSGMDGDGDVRLRVDFAYLNSVQPPGAFSGLLGLSCGRVRLSTPTAAEYASGRRQGDVEMLLDDVWCVSAASPARIGAIKRVSRTPRRPVCDVGWDDKDAAVICRSMGEPWTGAEATRGGAFGTTSTAGYAAFDIACSGLERDISECPFRGVQEDDASLCIPGRVAGVRCGHAVRLGDNYTVSLVDVRDDEEVLLPVSPEPYGNYLASTAHVLCVAAGFELAHYWFVSANERLSDDPSCRVAESFSCYSTTVASPWECGMYFTTTSCSNVRRLRVACSSTQLAGEGPRTPSEGAVLVHTGGRWEACEFAGIDGGRQSLRDTITDTITTQPFDHFLTRNSVCRRVRRARGPCGVSRAWPHDLGGLHLPRLVERWPISVRLVTRL